MPALTEMIFPPLTMISVPSITPSRSAGVQGETADAGDAWKGFAAKTHRGNGTEVFGFGDFAGGVAFQAKQRVVAAHADAVVGDTNETAAASLDLDSDSSRFGIERVLDQLFDDAGRTLNDFACRDLVRDVFG